MSLKKSKLFKHICQHIKKNWKFLPYIIRKLHEDTEFDYTTMYLRTLPNEDTIYNNGQRMWTFCFLCLKRFPDDIYLLFSEHPDGIYKKAFNNCKMIIINYNTPCIFGSNKLTKDCVAYCYFYQTLDNEFKYIDIDWISGVPLDIKIDHVLKFMESKVKDEASEKNFNEKKIKILTALSDIRKTIKKQELNKKKKLKKKSKIQLQ